jgi:hypothetical protein
MNLKFRNILFIFLGIAVDLSKRAITGPWQVTLHSYLGNVAVSFAVYFLCRNLPLPARFAPLYAGAMTLVVVELFELLDGFGLMSNVFDPFDLAANALGVLLAFVIDWATAPRGIPAAK